MTGDRDWINVRAASKHIIEDLPACRVLYSPQAVSYSQEDFENSVSHPLTERNLDRLREVTDVVERTMDEFSVKASQTPVITFGGPEQSGWINVIRDVDSKDFRTCRPLRKPEEFPWECYDEISKRLERSKDVRRYEKPGITVFEVSDKPGGTTEWE